METLYLKQCIIEYSDLFEELLQDRQDAYECHVPGDVADDENSDAKVIQLDRDLAQELQLRTDCFVKPFTTILATRTTMESTSLTVLDLSNGNDVRVPAVREVLLKQHPLAYLYAMPIPFVFTREPGVFSSYHELLQQNQAQTVPTNTPFILRQRALPHHTGRSDEEWASRCKIDIFERYSGVQPDIVLCWAEVQDSRVHVLGRTADDVEYDRCLIAQVISALNIIKPGGTILLQLSQCDSWTSIRVIEALDKISRLQLFKSRDRFVTESACQVVATNVKLHNPISGFSVEAWAKSWASLALEEHAQSQASLATQLAIFNKFGERYAEICNDVWEIERDGIRIAKAQGRLIPN